MTELTFMTIKQVLFHLQNRNCASKLKIQQEFVFMIPVRTSTCPTVTVTVHFSSIKKRIFSLNITTHCGTCL